jgi:hypothetical protein
MATRQALGKATTAELTMFITATTNLTGEQARELHLIEPDFAALLTGLRDELCEERDRRAEAGRQAKARAREQRQIVAASQR